MRLLWYILKYFLTGLLLGSLLGAEAQNSGEAENWLHLLAGKPGRALQQKSEKWEQDLQKAGLQHLRRMKAGEQKLKARLIKQDPALAVLLFADADSRYATWKKQLTDEAAVVPRMQQHYIARLDSLQTAMDFLKESAGFESGMPVKIRSLQHSFDQGEMVRELMEKRSVYLQQQLKKWGHFKDVNRLQGQVVRYREQMQRYRQAITSPSRIEEEVLKVLRKTPRFTSFFETHSMLAGLFPQHAGASPAQGAAGAQSREAVMQSIAQKAVSPEQVQKALTQQVGSASSLMDRFRRSLVRSGRGDEINMPVLVPQDSKRSRFADRFEVGTNLQTTKSNRFFPSTTDVGLSLGYRVNTKSIVGIGASYKMGWGGDLRHVQVSSQGAGMRTFIDYKWKGGIWLTGGAEMNYRARFTDFDVLRDYTAWQKSALFGISKKYQVSSKVKGNAQLLYDALWKLQVPRTQPILFRVGYQLK